jgi:hypothetical protein
MRGLSHNFFMNFFGMGLAKENTKYSKLSKNLCSNCYVIYEVANYVGMVSSKENTKIARNQNTSAF